MGLPLPAIVQRDVYLPICSAAAVIVVAAAVTAATAIARAGAAAAAQNDDDEHDPQAAAAKTIVTTHNEYLLKSCGGPMPSGLCRPQSILCRQRQMVQRQKKGVERSSEHPTPAACILGDPPYCDLTADLFDRSLIQRTGGTQGLQLS